MPTFAKNTVSTVIPSLRYDDALAAIDWLCSAFGFEKHAVYADDKGIVQPRAIGGRETQCPCVIVEDCEAHYARARAAGAEIVDALETKDYGGAGYSCRDLEGHLWWFGSYDPWAPEAQ
jgi:uncharacterized glyoxalase superfamily protein PhnB